MTELLTHFQEDVLADILQSIHLQSTLYCRAKLGRPGGSVCLRERLQASISSPGERAG